MDPRQKEMLLQKYPAVEENILSFGLDEGTLKNINAMNQRTIEEKVQQNIPVDTIMLPNEDFRAEEEIRIVLLGKTGAGKSATGNLLIGKRTYDESNSPNSATKHVKHGEAVVGDTKVRVIDTPGSCDTEGDEYGTEILKILDRFRNGIHIFLFVFNMGNPRFTTEQIKAFETLEETFKQEILQHCVFLYTFASQLQGKSISNYVENIHSGSGETNSRVSRIFYSVNNHVVTVENAGVTMYEKAIQRQTLVEYLKRVIEKSSLENRGRVYFYPGFSDHRMASGYPYYVNMTAEGHDDSAYYEYDDVCVDEFSDNEFSDYEEEKESGGASYRAPGQVEDIEERDIRERLSGLFGHEPPVPRRIPQQVEYSCINKRSTGQNYPVIAPKPKPVRDSKATRRDGGIKQRPTGQFDYHPTITGKRFQRFEDSKVRSSDSGIKERLSGLFGDSPALPPRKISQQKVQNPTRNICTDAEITGLREATREYLESKSLKEMKSMLKKKALSEEVEDILIHAELSFPDIPQESARNLIEHNLGAQLILLTDKKRLFKVRHFADALRAAAGMMIEFTEKVRAKIPVRGAKYH